MISLPTTYHVRVLWAIEGSLGRRDSRLPEYGVVDVWQGGWQIRVVGLMLKMTHAGIRRAARDGKGGRWLPAMAWYLQPGFVMSGG